MIYPQWTAVALGYLQPARAALLYLISNQGATFGGSVDLRNGFDDADYGQRPPDDLHR